MNEPEVEVIFRQVVSNPKFRQRLIAPGEDFVKANFFTVSHVLVMKKGMDFALKSFYTESGES